MSLGDYRAKDFIDAIDCWVKSFYKIMARICDSQIEDNRAKVYSIKLDDRTWQYINSRPHVTRTHCYDIEKNCGTLIKITCNDLYAELCGIRPNMNDGAEGWNFINISLTNNYMDLYKRYVFLFVKKIGY